MSDAFLVAFRYISCFGVTMLIVAPVPLPVRFDFEIAQGLARSLLGLAETLEHAAAVEAGLFDATTTDWTGFTRRWFDHRHLTLVARLRDAAAVARLEAQLMVTPPTVVLP